MALVATEATAPVHNRDAGASPEGGLGRMAPARPLGAGRLDEFLMPAAEGVLERWEVGPALGPVRNDGPELVGP